MEKSEFYPQDSIAALATPWGESALAVIRVSGRDSLERLEPVFAPAGSLRQAAGHTLLHGHLADPATEEAHAPSGPPLAGRERAPKGTSARGERIDEVLVAVYRGPRSFTGEDGAEIFTHGSPVIIRRVLGLLSQAGFRYAGPGEFTLRAFLNGKLDLTQAEAVNEIVRAKTDRARAMALNRLSGSIEGKIRELKEEIVCLLAAVEVRLDYPEEELDEPQNLFEGGLLERWQREMEKLLGTYRLGRIYQEGVAAVLAGRTNSGKSTLFNRLLKEDRAIVSELHGTTRDYLEGQIALEGIPVRLYDTAGYRKAPNAVEREGMRRTDSIVQGAQLILYLVDGGDGLKEMDREFLEANTGDGRLIRVWNKTDLAATSCPPGFLPLSAREGNGVEELCRVMTARILEGQGALDQDAPVIDSLRQRQLLERALEAFREFRDGLAGELPLDLLAVDLEEVLDALGEITGEVTSQDLLSEIFTRFCVGK